MNYLKDELSLKMKEYRRKNCLTQEQAAEKFGLSTIYYGEIERGNRVPSGSVLLSLCEGIGCSFDDITFSAATRDMANYNASNKNEITEILQLLRETPDITDSVLVVTRTLHDLYSKMTRR